MVVFTKQVQDPEVSTPERSEKEGEKKKTEEKTEGNEELSSHEFAHSTLEAEGHKALRAGSNMKKASLGTTLLHISLLPLFPYPSCPLPVFPPSLLPSLSVEC